MSVVGSCVLGFVCAFVVYFALMVGYTLYRKKKLNNKESEDKSERQEKLEEVISEKVELDED